MNGCAITVAGANLMALGSGALWWPQERILTVSDLHLGKSERIARRGGAMLPPFDTEETLRRLEAEIDALDPDQVICLGDSFDDLLAADAIAQEARPRLAILQAGRDWVWVEGNHDPGPVDFGGTHLREVHHGPLTFRHIAEQATGEVSGHYHPKARIVLRGRPIVRSCFVFDEHRLILPAFGTYTGGLWTSHAAISGLVGKGAQVVLTGKVATRLPMPR
ncbi:ligase-associated DNA damage response endonuclease PdeM [Celeribacter arenosi]|uniref:Ligase-associated DNA damage response endonuclease PdeM n=1 Tax=Celeribacter arenosi TaxID=792649 RepID=A0ABP7K7V3_9RHOB